MNLKAFFEGIADPRDEKKINYPLLNILFIAVAAVLAGAKTWQDRSDFGLSHQAWLATYLDLSQGIPSRYTFRRLFGLLQPKQIEQAFLDWAQLLAGSVEGCHIAIDGKSLGGTQNSTRQIRELQLVSAWCEEKNLILGQVATDSQSNEIKAIPLLVELLSIKDCLVSIDAAGCQRTIAEKILEKKADYLLALKKNQQNLYHEVESYLQQTIIPAAAPLYDEFEEGRGRCVRRRVFVGAAHPAIKALGWKNLTSLIAVETITDQTKKVHAQWRYYISSKSINFPFQHAIRRHWGIENRLHWVLDVHLGDDHYSSQERNSTLSLAALKRVAFNLVRRNDPEKKSVRRKLLRATWDIHYLEKILFGLPFH